MTSKPLTATPDAVKLAAYREAAERADDTIAALRQTIDVLQQSWQVAMSAAAEAKSEVESARRTIAALEAELMPFRKEFGHG